MSKKKQTPLYKSGGIQPERESASIDDGQQQFGSVSAFFARRSDEDVAKRTSRVIEKLSPSGIDRKNKDKPSAGKIALAGVALVVAGAIGTPQGRDVLDSLNGFIDNNMEDNDNKNYLPNDLPVDPSTLTVETLVPAPVDALNNLPSNQSGVVPQVSKQIP